MHCAFNTLHSGGRYPEAGVFLFFSEDRMKFFFVLLLLLFMRNEVLFHDIHILMLLIIYRMVPPTVLSIKLWVEHSGSCSPPIRPKKLRPLMSVYLVFVEACMESRGWNHGPGPLFYNSVDTQEKQASFKEGEVP